MITICISHLCTAVVHYTQQKEIRSENPIVTEHAVEENTVHKKGKVSVMRNSLRSITTVFQLYVLNVDLTYICRVFANK